MPVVARRKSGIPEQQSLFTPGFGRRPHLVAGRADEIAELEQSVLTAPHHPNSSNLILGQRGFGKTVLLNEIEDIASSSGWVVLKTDASSPGLAQRILVEAAKHPFVREVLSPSLSADATSATRAVGRGLHSRWASISKQTSETRPGPSVRDTLEVLGAACAEHDTGVLLTVDEMHAGTRDEMVRLAADLQLVIARDEMPVAFVGAALTEVLFTMLRDPRLSFFRRCEQYELGAVNDEEVSLFFDRGVKDGGGALDEDARDLLVRRAEGYPYKMQLLGHWAWRHADAPSRRINVEDAEFADQQASLIVRKRVHAHVWQNLSQDERALVRAVASYGLKAALWDISDLLPHSPEAITNMLARLGAIGALNYDGGTHVQLGPLLDTAFVDEVTAALSVMEQHRDMTSRGIEATTNEAETSPRQSLRPRCNRPMKQVPGRCIRPSGHSGRCRSR